MNAETVAGSGHLLYLIARREFLSRVRTKVFIFGTALMVIVLAAYIVVQVLVFARSSSTPFKVGLTGQAEVLANPLRASASAAGESVQVLRVSQGRGESQVRSGDLDALVSGPPTSPDVLVKDRINPALMDVLTGLVRQEALNSQLAAAGVDPAAVEARVAGARVRVRSLQPVDPERLQEQIIGLFAGVLLYVALLMYGTFVAQGVVDEKASRIVEILLSTVRPRQLLLGKVVGIGLVGFLQLAIVGGAGLILVVATNVVAVPTVGVGAILGALLWFVLGFFLYALLFAAGASLVSRQEEVPAVISPITILLVVAWLVALSVLLPEFGGQPIDTTGTVLSLLPPFAPVIMPSRMATGDAPLWQVLLAVALALAASWAMAWVAARIYANSVLRIGARVKLTEALRGATTRV
jgi:ABC-2 type transport system permease protein